jgi:hypothetical protein
VLNHILYRDNVFVESDGLIETGDLYDDETQTSLRLKITEALHEYLKSIKKMEQQRD